MLFYKTNTSYVKWPENKRKRKRDFINTQYTHIHSLQNKAVHMIITALTYITGQGVTASIYDFLLLLFILYPQLYPPKCLNGSWFFTCLDDSNLHFWGTGILIVLTYGIIIAFLYLIRGNDNIKRFPKDLRYYRFGFLTSIVKQ